MIVKRIFVVLLLLFAQSRLRAQLYSTATASTGAEIIVPVGTERSGEMISASFYPGKDRSIVTLNTDGIRVNGKNNTINTGMTSIPTLHILSSQQVYAITFSFDPTINNRTNSKETIQIGSINIVPVSELKDGEIQPDRYFIGATLLVGASQSPGQYVSGNPYTVTVHFN